MMKCGDTLPLHIVRITSTLAGYLSLSEPLRSAAA
jgi:hypothetical protein